MKYKFRHTVRLREAMMPFLSLLVLVQCFIGNYNGLMEICKTGRITLVVWSCKKKREREKIREREREREEEERKKERKKRIYI